MVTRLSDATRADVGGKAATLGALLRAGLPVLDGFVVPSDIQPLGTEVGHSLREAVARELERLGDPVVAVRSSAPNEDSTQASARATRVGDYWARSGDTSPPTSGMAVH